MGSGSQKRKAALLVEAEAHRLVEHVIHGSTHAGRGEAQVGRETAPRGVLFSHRTALVNNCDGWTKSGKKHVSVEERQTYTHTKKERDIVERGGTNKEKRHA